MSMSTDTFLSLVASYKIVAADAEAFRKIAAEAVAEYRKKPGCLYLTVGEDIAEPGLFHFSEGWISKAALDEHMASPDFQANLARARRLRIISRQIHVSEARGRTLVASEGEGSAADAS